MTCNIFQRLSFWIIQLDQISLLRGEIRWRLWSDLCYNISLIMQEISLMLRAVMAIGIFLFACCFPGQWDFVSPAWWEDTEWLIEKMREFLSCSGYSKICNEPIILLFSELLYVITIQKKRSFFNRTVAS